MKCDRAEHDKTSSGHNCGDSFLSSKVANLVARFGVADVLHPAADTALGKRQCLLCNRCIASAGISGRVAVAGETGIPGNPYILINHKVQGVHREFIVKNFGLIHHSGLYQNPVLFSGS